MALSGRLCCVRATLLLMCLVQNVQLGGTSDPERCVLSGIGAASNLTTSPTCSFDIGWKSTKNCSRTEVLVLHPQHSQYDYVGNVCKYPIGWTNVKDILILQHVFSLTKSTFNVCAASKFVDTCQSAILTTMHLQDLFSPQNNPFFVLGPALSSEMAVASPQLSAMALPHISHFATSEIFDDTSEFPYLFRTIPSDREIVRAISAVIRHFKWSYIAVVASAQLPYGAKGLEGMRRESQRSLLSRNSFCIGLATTMPRALEDLERISLTLQRIAADPSIKVIVLFTLLQEAEQFLACMMARNMSDYVILGTEAWVTRIDVTAIRPTCACCIGNAEACAARRALPDILGLEPWSLNEDAFNTYAAHLKFTITIGEKTSLATYWEQNPWLLSFLLGEDTKSNCSSRCNGAYSPLECNNVADLLVKRLQDQNLDFRSSSPLLLTASIVVAGYKYLSNSYNLTDYSHELSFCYLKDATVPCSKLQTEYLPPVAFTCNGETCMCRAFTETQSAWPLYNLIQLTNATNQVGYNVLSRWSGVNSTSAAKISLTRQPVWTSSSSSGRGAVPESTCRRPCRPGERRVNSTILSNSCCWSCAQCAVHSVSSGTTDKCVECERDSAKGIYMTSSAERTHCISSPISYLGIDSGFGAAQIALRAAIVVFVLVMLAVFAYHSDVDLIYSMDLTFTSVVFALTILGFGLASTVLLEPGHVQCVATKLIDVPFINFSPAVVLIRALHLLAVSESRGAETTPPARLRHFRSTAWQMLALSVIMAASELIGLIIYAAGGVELTTTENSADPNKLQKECTYSDAALAVSCVWQAVVLVAATCAAMQARHEKRSGSEGMMLMTSAVCFIFIIAAFQPAIYLTGISFRPHLESLMIGAQMFVMIILLYGSRFYLLIRHRHEILDEPRKTQ